MAVCETSNLVSNRAKKKGLTCREGKGSFGLSETTQRAAEKRSWGERDHHAKKGDARPLRHKVQGQGTLMNRKKNG